MNKRRNPNPPPSRWKINETARACQLADDRDPNHEHAAYRRGVRDALLWVLGRNREFDREQRRARKLAKQPKGKS